jgi:hypothetical protein
MNYLIKISKLILFTCLLTSFFTSKAQVSSINQTLLKIEQEVNVINQYANSNQIYEAVNQLNETRRYFDNYLTHYFDEEFWIAKNENPSFIPSINVQFSKKLTTVYWSIKLNPSLPYKFISKTELLWPITITIEMVT